MKRTIYSELPDHLVFQAVHMILQQDPVAEIVSWAEQQGHPISREQVYPLLREGFRREFLRVKPPAEHLRAERLREKFPQASDVRVVNVLDEDVGHHLAHTAADLILSLIRDVAEQKVSAGRGDEGIHLGFGAGGTTQMVAESLGQLLRSETDLPQLTIHALSSGFAMHDPLQAPVSFFSRFFDVHPSVQFVGLFAPAVVRSDDYEKVLELPGVKESFEEGKKIDIIVTSLAEKSDEDGLLNRFLRAKTNTGLAELEKQGWVGDVQWRPFSQEGPIEVKTGFRAVTLFELHQLTDLLDQGKHVVLVAGPCLKCKKSKSVALRPLLTQSKLRVFNHLIMDITTANKLIRGDVEGG
jgi:DNA-binding transcriptional regulator LsrR (DeoR family)